ncbi:MAG: NAD-dependent protein deacylase [Lachnospiraceae bacterium]
MEVIYVGGDIVSENRLNKIIQDSKKLVFFGGAGVSTESGIPDFRSSTGIYSEKNIYPPEQIVSHSFFLQHTEEFYDFYKNKMIFLDAKPNKAHLKLAQLEASGILTAVITQNIDGLHQIAGSKNVLELHGSIHRNYCQHCHRFYDAAYVKHALGIPKCECGGIIKPDVVLYEEGLDQKIISQSIQAISQADTLIIGGTSLVVYPAASFIDYFQGKNLIVINKTATPRDDQGTLCLHGAIGEILGGVPDGK